MVLVVFTESLAPVYPRKRRFITFFRYREASGSLRQSDPGPGLFNEFQVLLNLEFPFKKCQAIMNAFLLKIIGSRGSL